MSVVGLITEYNPFHNGHAYHINEAKKITDSNDLVVVMSGNYVQRGEPAIVDKWTRTRIALLNGADLVIEIPTIFATSSAEFFSNAAIALLEATGIVDSLCFGSEVGEIWPLQHIANALSNESLSYQYRLKEYIKQGVRYPIAREKALSDTLGSVSKEVIGSPNNILGIEYLKSLTKFGSTIEPYTLKRIGASYHDLSSETIYSSASAIRHLLNENGETTGLTKFMPKSAEEMLLKSMENNTAPISFEDCFVFLRYRINLMGSRELSEILDVSEGLENRIITAIKSTNSMKELTDAIATKRYTNTRIRRALLHILLDIKKEDAKGYIQSDYGQYIKVLGFKKEKRHLMKDLKTKTSLPLIVNVRDAMDSLNYLPKKMLQQEINYTNIYNNIVYNRYGHNLKNEFTHPIIIQE